MLDARHLTSNTDQSFESWPFEPLVPQLARANKNIKYAIDFMEAYARASLAEETITLTKFLSGGYRINFIRGFYALKRIPNFFTKQMFSSFQNLLKQGFALLWIISKTPLLNALFEDLHVIDITFVMTVFLLPLWLALSHQYYDITLYLFHLILFHHKK